MRLIAAGIALILLLAFVAHEQEAKTAQTVTCGQVTGGATVTAKGVDWAQDLGDWIHNLAETPIDSSTVLAAVKGVEKVLWYWIRTWFLSSKGLKLDPEILRLQQQAEAARAAAEAQCTPCPQALPQDSSPLASLGAAVATGSPEEVARQVAARYWPADQVDTAVAVAGAESTFNPKAHNNYGEGVDGLWQINRQAHRDLVAGKDLTDPSVNAALAYQIWKDAGNSWTPWTTYTSGSYKKFLKTSSVQATAGGPPPQPEQSAPVNPQNVGCQSSGMPAVRVATWNSYCGARVGIHCGTGLSAAGRVVPAVKKIAAQADVFGLQEMSNSERRAAVADALPDFGIVGGDTSDPIYYRKTCAAGVTPCTAFTLTAQDTPLIFRRSDDYEGPSQGDRHVNTAVLRTATGQQLTFINMHQLPQVQKDRVLNKAWPKRIRKAKELWAAAFTSARTHISTGAVVVVGDMNYDGPIPGAAEAGLTSASSIFGDLKQATRTRDIDQILFSAGRPTSERIIGAFGSDHSARVVDFPGDVTSNAAPMDGVTPADFNFPGQRTVEQAITYMQAQQSSSAWGSRCLAVVARAYGQASTQPVNGHYYAVGQWYAMPARYKHDDGSVPPRGALVFWKTGNPAGHIAISAGGGYVWTSDPPGGRHGSVAKVPIERVDSWGPRLGWSSPYFVGRTGGAAA